MVETHPLGYVVRLADGALDLQRFEQLLDEGRRLLDAGRPQEAGAVLRDALALWRGEPLADFRYEAFAANEIGRLEELRLIALEHRLEADLAVGRNAESVPELEALVRDHPLRESLRGLLMRALYRSGRQADALAVMQDARATLRDELGLDPGQALQQLEKAILLQDPSLDAHDRSGARAASRRSSRPSSSPLPPPAELAARAQRKVVTVLFADVTDSTLLGETFDPEVVRAMLATYFERMRAAAERHGGVVEKFIGDAVMAVFGIPAVHEDDALRALRAALEMREAIVELGMEGRIGLESGECVVGTGERLVTGRAVTTAARLEQAAQPGEILVGERHDAARPRLRGRRGARAARPQGQARAGAGLAAAVGLAERAGPPLRLAVRRARARAGDADARRGSGSATEERCELVSVVGAAGLGKSRLVAELLSRVDATVAHGRCLSYGAGITYWPVLEMLTQLQPHLDDGRRRDRRPAARAARGRRHVLDRRARVGVPQVRRGGRARAAAGARLRRHPLGRGGAARPDRARRVRLVGRADPAPLHGPPGAARPPAGLARARAPRAADARADGAS